MEVRILAAVVVAAALGIVIALQYTAFVTCGQDTSYCPETSEKNGHLTGVIHSEQGRVLPRTQVTIDLDPAGEQRVSTDDQGRVCIFWANGTNKPSVRTFPEGDGTDPTDRLEWTANADRAPPAGCARTSGTIRWNQADDLTSDPRFVAPGALAGAAAFLLFPALTGLGTGRRGRRRGNYAAALSLALVGLAWIGIFAINVTA